MSRISDAGSVMETDIGYSEPSSRPFEGEAATSAEQWANWTTNEIRSAIEAEREYMEGLLAENKTNPRCGAQSGRPGLPASCQSPRSGNARRSSTKPLSSCMMVLYQALRDTGEPPDNEAHWQCRAAPWARRQVATPLRDIQGRLRIRGLRRHRAQWRIVSRVA